MFNKKVSCGYKTQSPGIHYKTLVFGLCTSLHEFNLESGSKIPMHSHPHEQTGYLVQGRMNFIFKERTILAEAGDSWSIPSQEEHGVHALEDCVVIEVFSPVRKEYIS